MSYGSDEWCVFAKISVAIGSVSVKCPNMFHLKFCLSRIWFKAQAPWLHPEKPPQKSSPIFNDNLPGWEPGISPLLSKDDSMLEYAYEGAWAIPPVLHDKLIKSPSIDAFTTTNLWWPEPTLSQWCKLIFSWKWFTQSWAHFKGVRFLSCKKSVYNSRPKNLASHSHMMFWHDHLWRPSTIQDFLSTRAAGHDGIWNFRPCSTASSIESQNSLVKTTMAQFATPSRMDTPDYTMRRLELR